MTTPSNHIAKFAQRLKDHPRGYSEHTLVGYQTDLYQFLDWLGKRKLINLFPARITQGHMLEYRDHLYEDHQYAHGSVNRKLCSVRALFRYLVWHSHCKSNPAREVLVDDHEKPLPQILDLKQVCDMIGYAYTDDHLFMLRDRVILNGLYDLTARPGELRVMAWADVDTDTRRVSVGKDDGRSYRNRQVEMNEMTRMSLIRYRKTLDLWEKDYDRDILILNKSGRQLTVRSINRIFEKYRVMAGLPPWVCPYTFKHSRIVHLMQQGRSYRDIQYMMGYQSLSTLREYEKLL